MTGEQENTLRSYLDCATIRSLEYPAAWSATVWDALKIVSEQGKYRFTDYVLPDGKTEVMSIIETEGN